MHDGDRLRMRDLRALLPSGFHRGNKSDQFKFIFILLFRSLIEACFIPLAPVNRDRLKIQKIFDDHVPFGSLDHGAALSVAACCA